MQKAKINKIIAMCDSLPDGIVIDLCYGLYSMAKGRARVNKAIGKAK